MEVFTYKDYIKCIHTLRLNAVFRLAEESAEYNLETGKQKRKVDNIHNKIIEKILKNKSEVAGIISDFTDTKEKIKDIDLEKYTNNFLTRKYESKETNIYKLKDRNVFFLIEYQSSIDNDIAFRMLNCCVDIIYSWNTSVKIKKGIKYPIVVPIVIYTGTDKCDAFNDFSKMQVSDYVFKNYKINFKYNIIEINKLSFDFLIQKNTLFSYTIALAKTTNYEEFKNILNQILIQNKGNFNKEFYDISAFLFENLIKDSFNEEFLEETYFKIEKGGNNMPSLYEKQIQGFKQDVKNWVEESEHETLRKIVENLIANNSSDEFILKITNITKSELEKIKKELLINKEVN